jgi:two-component system, OmpR family, response regulator
MAQILLIDDDTRLRELLAEYLGSHGLVVTCASDGALGLRELERQSFEAVVLDIMMPGMDGLEALRRIRAKSPVPVLMLTAKGDETDRIVGLEIGADDYIGKPFSPRELLARLRAVLRRASGMVRDERLVDGPLTLDLASRTTTLEGAAIDLTGYEFDLLRLLIQRSGRIVARDALQRETGREEVSDRAIDVHISHLRKKLGEMQGARIKTVRGVGYVYTKGNS